MKPCWSTVGGMACWTFRIVSRFRAPLLRLLSAASWAQRGLLTLGSVSVGVRSFTWPIFGSTRKNSTSSTAAATPTPAKIGARLPPTRLTLPAASGERVLRQVDAAAERVSPVFGPVSVALENQGFTQPFTDSSRVSQLARALETVRGAAGRERPDEVVVGVVGTSPRRPARWRDPR